MLHTQSKNINEDNLFTNYNYEKRFEKLSTNLRKLFEDSKDKFNWGDNKYRRDEFKKRTLRSGDVKSLLGIIKSHIDNERFQEILDLYYSHYDIDSDRTPILRKVGETIYDFNTENASVVRVNITAKKIAQLLGANVIASTDNGGGIRFEDDVDDKTKARIRRLNSYKG